MHRLVGWFAALAAITATGLIAARGSLAIEPRVAAQGLQGKAAGTALDRARIRALKRAVDEGRAYIPGRVIVKFQEGLSRTSKVSSLSRVGGAATLLPAHAYADFDLVEIAANADPAAAAAAIAGQPGVEYAEPEGLRYVSFRPNDPSYTRQWNMPAINMEGAWDINQGGSATLIVAVLDSGIAYKTDTFRLPRFFGGQLRQVDVPILAAPDLARDNRFAAPFDFVWGDDEPVDFDGHGTHVAGTVAQTTNNNAGLSGVAFNVRLMPVKVCAGAWDFLFILAEDGVSTVNPDISVCGDSEISQGIRWAADHDAKVINLSLGGPGAQSQAVGAALRYAVGRGVFVSIAAGNEFEEGNPVSHPASFAPEIQGVVAVSAVGRNLQRAFYSNTGTYVELAAPGGNSRDGGTAGLVVQQTLNPQFFPVTILAPRFDVMMEGSFQGTSMAAPHVAGLAALLMSQGITNPAAIEAALRHFARDLGPAGLDQEYGSGLIDARATLRGLGVAR